MNSKETLNSSLFFPYWTVSPIPSNKIVYFYQEEEFEQPKCLFDEYNSNIIQIENKLNEEIDQFNQFEMGRLMYDRSKIAKRDFYSKTLKQQHKKYKRKFVRKDSRSLIKQSKCVMNLKRKSFRFQNHSKRYSYLNNRQRSQQLYQIKCQKQKHQSLITSLKKKVLFYFLF